MTNRTAASASLLLAWTVCGCGTPQEPEPVSSPEARPLEPRGVPGAGSLDGQAHEARTLSDAEALPETGPHAGGSAPPSCPPPLSIGGFGPDTGWPSDPELIVAQLNEWDRDELEVVARPDAHPDRVPSGETNAWVAEHLDQISSLGATVAWNPTERCYGLVSR